MRAVKVKIFHTYRGVSFTIEISCNRLEGVSLLPELLNALTRFIDKLNKPEGGLMNEG